MPRQRVHPDHAMTPKERMRLKRRATELGFETMADFWAFLKPYGEAAKFVADPMLEHREVCKRNTTHEKFRAAMGYQLLEPNRNKAGFVTNENDLAEEPTASPNFSTTAVLNGNTFAASVSTVSGRDDRDQGSVPQSAAHLRLRINEQ
jgi:hypothetical protein